MKNQAHNSSNSENFSNSITPFFQHQNILANEQQDEGWNYQEFLGLLERRVVVIVGVATTVMAGVAINFILNPKPAEYESSFQMLIEPVANDNKVIDVLQEFRPLQSFNQSSLDYESQILVLKSPELIENSIKELQVTYPYINYNNLIKSLKIARLGTTKVIEVRYRSLDPVESKAVLDKISNDYVEYSKEKEQTRLGKGLQYINQEIPIVQKRVDKVQKELQIFQRKYNLIDPASFASQIADQKVNVIQQQQELEIKVAQARANYASLQSEEGMKALLDSYPVYQELNTELRQLDIEIASASTVLQDENPKIITLKETRDRLIPLIQQESERYIRTKRTEAASLLQSLEINKQELEKNQQILEQQTRQLPNLFRQYTEIKRNLELANVSLNSFLSSRENLQIQNSQTQLGWQLIQRPNEPTNPVVSSNIIRDIIAGLAASIFLAMGAALIMEKLDYTYHDAWILKERVQLPLLGNIPLYKQLETGQSQTIKPQDTIMAFSDSLPETINDVTSVARPGHNNYSTNFAEAIRVLYTNIQLLNSDSQIRSITVSSAMAGEGKTTIAFNLAQIAASIGKRVLLVDGDMRRPTIHTLSNLKNLWGLSSLITSNLPFEKVVKQLPEMDKLSIITSGPLPPDCTKLLSSEKMKRLMREFYNEFDLVIYDTPPASGLADATLIGSQTDGLLIIARIDKTDRSVFERAVADLKLAPINILGIVANGQKGNFRNYYYYQASSVKSPRFSFGR